MTAAQVPTPPTESDVEGPQRFVFSGVDWAFYEEVCDRLQDRHVFVTFYKGKLEVVTTSMLHEMLSSVLAVIIGVVAEENDIKILAAGRSTLRRHDLDEGVEPDVSFYIAHQAEMLGRKEIDLAADPPPDLAIEIEVTHRLGARRSIYQDMGVPEIWLYSVADGLRVLVRQPNGAYASAPASPSFPGLSLNEVADWVRAGQSQDQTTFTKMLRQRVRQSIEADRRVD